MPQLSVQETLNCIKVMIHILNDTLHPGDSPAHTVLEDWEWAVAINIYRETLPGGMETRSTRELKIVGDSVMVTDDTGEEHPIIIFSDNEVREIMGMLKQACDNLSRGN